MEGELWRQVYALAKRLGKASGVIRGRFLDVEIIAVYLWSVLHDRPVGWACKRANWRGRCPMKCLPSPSTMSRRLRAEGVQRLLCDVEKELLHQRPASWCRFIDGKPLPVSGHSEDSPMPLMAERQAQRPEDTDSTEFLTNRKASSPGRSSR